MSKRFVLFGWVVKLHQIKIVEKIDNLVKLPPLKQKPQLEMRKKELVGKVENFNKKYNVAGRKIYDWSGCNISKKAEKAGKDMELIYQTVYKYNSNIEHSNVVALDKYVKNDIPGKIDFLSEPSESHVEQNLSDSFNIFIRMLDVFYDYFKLEKFLKEKQNLIKEFEKIYQKSEAL